MGCGLAQGDHWRSVELYLDFFGRHPGSRHRASVREGFHAALSGALAELRLGDSRDVERFTGLAGGVVRTCGGSDAVALRMLGLKCLNEGVYHQAYCLLQAATQVTIIIVLLLCPVEETQTLAADFQIDPECLLTRENLWMALEGLVRRWHFYMLNDIRRNSAYWEAIGRAVHEAPGCTVMDIGAGTGILR